MIALHVVAGNDDGGDHAHVTFGDINCEPHELTDEQVAQARESVRDVYRKSFGIDPESVIVYVEEQAPA